MRAAIRRRDLFASPSLRDADPRLGLLSGSTWEAARPAICRTLGLSTDAPAEVARLSWVRQNYIRAETLTRANAALVASQNRIPLARSWGGGDVASADGLRSVVPIRTIHSEPNPHYFGQERGVTFYNLVCDQFIGLNGITVPGTLRDSLVLLSVVLEQHPCRPAD